MKPKLLFKYISTILVFTFLWQEITLAYPDVVYSLRPLASREKQGRFSREEIIRIVQQAYQNGVNIGSYFERGVRGSKEPDESRLLVQVFKAVQNGETEFTSWGDVVIQAGIPNPLDLVGNYQLPQIVQFNQYLDKVRATAGTADDPRKNEKIQPIPDSTVDIKVEAHALYYGLDKDRRYVALYKLSQGQIVTLVQRFKGKKWKYLGIEKKDDKRYVWQDEPEWEIGIMTRTPKYNYETLWYYIGDDGRLYSLQEYYYPKMQLTLFAYSGVYNDINRPPFEPDYFDIPIGNRTGQVTVGQLSPMSYALRKTFGPLREVLNNPTGHLIRFFKHWSARDGEWHVFVSLNHDKFDNVLFCYRFRDQKLEELQKVVYEKTTPEQEFPYIARSDFRPIARSLVERVENSVPFIHHTIANNRLIQHLSPNRLHLLREEVVYAGSGASYGERSWMLFDEALASLGIRRGRGIDMDIMPEIIGYSQAKFGEQGVPKERRPIPLIHDMRDPWPFPRNSVKRIENASLQHVDQASRARVVENMYQCLHPEGIAVFIKTGGKPTADHMESLAQAGFIIEAGPIPLKLTDQERRNIAGLVTKRLLSDDQMREILKRESYGGWAVFARKNLARKAVNFESLKFTYEKSRRFGSYSKDRISRPTREEVLVQRAEQPALEGVLNPGSVAALMIFEFPSHDAAEAREEGIGVEAVSSKRQRSKMRQKIRVLFIALTREIRRWSLATHGERNAVERQAVRILYELDAQLYSATFFNEADFLDKVHRSSQASRKAIRQFIDGHPDLAGVAMDMLIKIISTSEEKQADTQIPQMPDLTHQNLINTEACI